MGAKNIEKNEKLKNVLEKSKVAIKIFFLIVFIVCGITSLTAGKILEGIYALLFALSLTTTFYEKTRLDKVKYIKIILPVVLFFLFISATPTTSKVETSEVNNQNIATSSENVVETKEIPKINSIKINEENFQMDIKEEKEISLTIEPEDADTEEIEVCLSNAEILTVEKIQDENKVTLKVKPAAEGTTEIYVKSKEEIESNKIEITVIDNERIEREKQEAEEIQRKAEEEAKKKADEEAAKKAQEEATQKAQSAQTTKSTQTSTTASTRTTTPVPVTTDNSRTVYITPTGECYHFDPDCSGKNSTPTTLDSALSRGYRYCKKCAR